MARIPPPKRKRVAYGLLKDYEKKRDDKKDLAQTIKDVNGRLRYSTGSDKGKLVFPALDPGGRLSDEDKRRAASRRKRSSVY